MVFSIALFLCEGKGNGQEAHTVQFVWAPPCDPGNTRNRRGEWAAWSLGRWFGFRERWVATCAGCLMRSRCTKAHEGHVGKQCLIWGKWTHVCSTFLHHNSRLQNLHFNLLRKPINFYSLLHAAINLCIKVQGCKTHASTFYVTFNWCICYPCLLCLQTYTCYFQCMCPDKR